MTLTFTFLKFIPLRRGGAFQRQSVQPAFLLWILSPRVELNILFIILNGKMKRFEFVSWQHLDQTILVGRRAILLFSELMMCSEPFSLSCRDCDWCTLHNNRCYELLEPRMPYDISTAFTSSIVNLSRPEDSIISVIGVRLATSFPPW